MIDFKNRLTSMEKIVHINLLSINWTNFAQRIKYKLCSKIKSYTRKWFQARAIIRGRNWFNICKSVTIRNRTSRKYFLVWNRKKKFIGIGFKLSEKNMKNKTILSYSLQPNAIRLKLTLKIPSIFKIKLLLR